MISLDDQFTTDSLEEKVREYWQIGQRQVSAKSGLSAEIRRIFEKLPVLDAEGNQMTDPYGFGLPLFVDSDVAVNSILNWIKDARTMEDMENILKKMSTSFPWVNSVLNKIKEEPFRSQFYTNFRKDFINYSIIVADTAADGTRAYKVMTINVKGSV